MCSKVGTFLLQGLLCNVATKLFPIVPSSSAVGSYVPPAHGINKANTLYAGCNPRTGIKHFPSCTSRAFVTTVLCLRFKTFSSTIKLMEAVLQAEATRNPQQPCHIFPTREKQ
jgi:hypothetical protein